MDETASLTLGKRILYHRKRLGLTQDQLAERMGVTAQAVSKWEHDLSCPDVTTVPRLAELFGISTDELLGVARAPEEPRKSHVGEVVDEVVRDAEESGFHMDWQGSGIWFALFLILTGVTYLAAIYWKLETGLWSILWPYALLTIGLSSCASRVSAFGIGAAVSGVYFLLVNLGIIPSLITWPVVLGFLLILWGLSMILDRAYRRRGGKGRHAHITVNGKPLDDEERSRRFFSNDSGEIRGDFAFCSDRILVQAEQFQGGKVEVAFGSLVLDLTGCQSVARDCRLYLDTSFGNLVLQIPRQYRVELDIDRTGGGMNVSGKPDDVCRGTIVLEGEVSFGTMKIQYV